MHSLSSLPPVQQFILDCFDVASSLDSLDPRDYRVYLIAAVLSSQTQYQSLLLRRRDLSPSGIEEAWIDFLLDGLLARLRRLKCRIGIGAPVQHISHAITDRKAG